MCVGRTTPDQINFYRCEIDRVISAAFRELQTRLTEAGSCLSAQALSWTDKLSRHGPREDYFKHPESFPILLLPWFLERQITSNIDTAFQQRIVYSTVNGYYAVRLVDNLMDGHGNTGLLLLPLLNFFHSQFQFAYQQYFPYKHPFWKSFTRLWSLTADATMRDGALSDITWTQFNDISAQKSCGAAIPLVAVCWRVKCPNLIDPWLRLADLFGRWHQMKNDTFDWQKDLNTGTQTYFLSEAERERRENESATDWILREGLFWGFGVIKNLMLELKSVAEELENQDLSTYLIGRERMMEKQMGDLAESLNELNRLSAEVTRALQRDNY